MQDHRKLLVWQKAHTLAVQVSEAVRLVTRRDRSGMASQASRAALSIPSNIAEGCARGSNRDFARFLRIAIASASELDYQLEYARDAKLISKEQVDRLLKQVIEVRRMLYGLLKRVEE